MAETVHAVLDRARMYWASDSRKGVISFRSPLEIWAENPTFLLAEVMFFTWAALTMKHGECRAQMYTEKNGVDILVELITSR